jgi:hypothetical protein
MQKYQENEPSRNITRFKIPLKTLKFRIKKVIFVT